MFLPWTRNIKFFNKIYDFFTRVVLGLELPLYFFRGCNKKLLRKYVAVYWRRYTSNLLLLSTYLSFDHKLLKVYCALWEYKRDVVCLVATQSWKAEIFSPCYRQRIKTNFVKFQWTWKLLRRGRSHGCKLVIHNN